MTDGTKVGFFEVDPNFLEMAGRIIQHTTTALIKIQVGRNRTEKNTHIGSGTFVKIGEHFGILTAQHVANELDGPSRLGLTIQTSEHKFTIARDLLKIIMLTEPKTEEHGPDLAFIGIPNHEASTINRSMGFFNLTTHRQTLMEKPPELNLGWWLLCGVPELGTREEKSQTGFKKVLALEHFACEGNIDKPFFRDTHDYTDMTIDFTKYHNSPISFKGMSGGGLWQLLFESKEGTLKVKSYLFSGVIFYQGPLVNNQRKVRSHFRSSVYNWAYDEILRKL